MPVYKRSRLSLLVAAVFLVGGIGVLLTRETQAQKKKPPATVEIKGCDKEKGPVKFKHKAHVDAIKKHKLGKEGDASGCKTCHHKGKEGDSCAKCHMKATKGLGTCQDKSAKKNPFHVMCIGCHKKVGTDKPELKKAAAAVKCKNCHTGAAKKAE